MPKQKVHPEKRQVVSAQAESSPKSPEGAMRFHEYPQVRGDGDKYCLPHANQPPPRRQT